MGARPPRVLPPARRCAMPPADRSVGLLLRDETTPGSAADGRSVPGQCVCLGSNARGVPGSSTLSMIKSAMLHWRSVPFLVHDHTLTASLTMPRTAVWCAGTLRNSSTPQSSRIVQSRKCPSLCPVHARFPASTALLTALLAAAPHPAASGPASTHSATQSERAPDRRQETGDRSARSGPGVRPRVAGAVDAPDLDDPALVPAQDPAVGQPDHSRHRPALALHLLEQRARLALCVPHKDLRRLAPAPQLPPHAQQTPHSSLVPPLAPARGSQLPRRPARDRQRKQAPRHGPDPDLLPDLRHAEHRRAHGRVDRELGAEVHAFGVPHADAPVRVPGPHLLADRAQRLNVGGREAAPVDGHLQNAAHEPERRLRDRFLHSPPVRVQHADHLLAAHTAHVSIRHRTAKFCKRQTSDS
eukprot:3250014-Rhodomonas_salina.1